ncbi:hypothetical protein [Actinoplanes sp. G11-F43]
MAGLEWALAAFRGIRVPVFEARTLSLLAEARASPAEPAHDRGAKVDR